MIADAVHDGSEAIHCQHSEIEHGEVHEQHIPSHDEPRSRPTVKAGHFTDVPQDEKRHVGECVEDINDSQVRNQNIGHSSQSLEADEQQANYAVSNYGAYHNQGNHEGV